MKKITKPSEEVIHPHDITSKSIVGLQGTTSRSYLTEAIMNSYTFIFFDNISVYGKTYTSKREAVKETIEKRFEVYLFDSTAELFDWILEK